MTERAASLVANARQWASYYGDYPNGEQGAVLTAPLRIRAAWDANDAGAFAGMFIEDGSLLVGDHQLVSREEIASYLAEAFDGAYRGSRLTEEPREIRLLTDTVAVAVTQGGVIPEGKQSLAPADEVRTMWVIVKRDGDWRVASRQSSPLRGTAPATGSWGDASAILAAAGVTEDVSYYRQFTEADERAVLTVPMRIQAAWAANDPDAFADVFTDNGSLLMRDTQLTSREEIRSFMAAGFAGPFKGFRVKGWPVALKVLTDQVAMVITEGGMVRPGEVDIADENLIRSTWVIARQPDGRISLVSHQSSPLKG